MKFSQFKIVFLIIPLSSLVLIFALSVLLKQSTDFDKLKIFKQQKVHQNCRDWNDYEQMIREREREGFGENGEAGVLTNPQEIAENERLYNETGFSVVISNKISVNRSIPDVRHVDCDRFKYPRILPSASVIIIFHNEVMSVLLRTIHSVVNRTPSELLHEIILVNDKSTHEELYEPLAQYVRENFPNKIKIKNLTERKGLIVTRLEGAAIATGDVLVFFDSHIEVGYNWLPPLLAPIKANRRIATVPVIDDFDPNDFSVRAVFAVGDRGGIDWTLVYRHFSRYMPEGIDQLKPFPTPIMLGCAFAIDRSFFLDELDGYDREFKIWNGENYELSFKLWLCADGLYEVPCSRITHSFRLHNPSRISSDDYVGRNFKRLVEVWFDDYKQHVYSREPERYNKIDAGDLTHVKAVHNQLKCKPFKYFLDEIAPDILARYPIDENIPLFAHGQIKSLKYTNVCIDTFYRSEFDTIGLYYCAELDSGGNPPQSQYFRLNFNKNIVLGRHEYCLDSYKLSTPQCHYSELGNQYWKYDLKHHMLINEHDEGVKCLAGNFSSQEIFIKKCDIDDEDQKWKFTHENETALNNWKDIYGYTKFTYGDVKFKRDKMLPLENNGEC